MDIKKKYLTILGEKNGFTYTLKNYFDFFQIVEIQILNKTTREIYLPENEIWFLRWQHSFNNDMEFFNKNNVNLGNSILGLYSGTFLNFTNELTYIDLYYGNPIPIRDNQIKLEIVDEKGLLINFEKLNLEFFLMIQV